MDRRKLEYYIGVTEELETFVRDADDSAEDDYNDRMGDFGNFQDTPLHWKHILLLEKIRGLRQFMIDTIKENGRMREQQNAMLTSEKENRYE